MRSASSRCRSSTGTGASDATLGSYNPFTNEITIHEDRVAASTLSLEHVQLHEQLPSMYELKEFNPSVSDATVYKHIQKRIDAGIVKEVALDDDQRRQGYPWKFYALTEEGQQFLEEQNLLAAEETFQQIFETISDKPKKMVKYENAPLLTTCSRSFCFRIACYLRSSEAYRDNIRLTNRHMPLAGVLVNTRRQLMSYEPPTPPADLPTDIVDTLDEYCPERLQHVARYAETLAEHKEREARLEEESDEEEIEERADDLPDNVPPKATVTIKEINDNRYYYWQWREGDKVTSKYKGPVNPDE